jgi:hypothetical protein
MLLIDGSTAKVQRTAAGIDRIEYRPALNALTDWQGQWHRGSQPADEGRLKRTCETVRFWPIVDIEDS